MFLTSPLIEQAIALKFRLLSFPFKFDGFVSTRKMSSMGICTKPLARRTLARVRGSAVGEGLK